MTKEEMQLALKEELKTFKDNMPAYVSKEDLDAQSVTFEDKLKELNMKSEIDGLKEAVEKQGLELNKIAERGPKIVKSLEDIVKEQGDKFNKLSKKEGGAFSFIVPKTDVTTASVTTPSSSATRAAR